MLNELTDPFFETLFGQSDRGQFIGLISEEKAVYRYDLAWRRLLAWASLPDECGPTTQKPSDGSIWTICGGVLVRIDSRTLKCKPIGRFANPVTLMTWLGDDLTVATGTDSGYTAGAELHKVTLPRRGTGAPPVGRGVEAVRGRRSGAGR